MFNEKDLMDQGSNSLQAHNTMCASFKKPHKCFVCVCNWGQHNNNSPCPKIFTL